tara:strand:- start:4238 stop:5989 length:1752 start_codon:yes stop_codon:yes gene_type:complete
MIPFTQIRLSALMLVCALFTACSPTREESQSLSGLTKVVLQTDWFAQPEHGGFYQALAKGYYEEAGLDVEIVPGGPNAMTKQKVSQGKAHFSFERSDQVIVAASNGIPLMMQGAIMQQDPQAILFHKESGIEDFQDLDGRTIMAIPGSTFVTILEKNYGITIDVIPMDFGTSRFLADKNFIQQCFITNEPYFVDKQGANPGTLLLSDSGFQPYRVWYTTRRFARTDPEVVQAFSAATIRGWKEYINGDRTEADALIMASNPKQTPELIAYSVEVMKKYNLVEGNPDAGERMGHIDPERIRKQITQLSEIGMLEESVGIDEVLGSQFLDTDDSKDEATVRPNDSLKFSHFKNDIKRSKTIRYEELLILPTRQMQVSLPGSEEPQAALIVYLTDVITAFQEDPELDFWLANCGDRYQSNYTRQQIDSAKPYLIVKVAGQPLVTWLSTIGRPELGPFIVNIENDEGLLDPIHKYPWGTYEIVALKQEEALKDWADSARNKAQEAGLRIYLNACSNCHISGNGIMGGSMSTRPITLISIFSKQAEPYFRNILKDPKGTNPLAEKMPAFDHYSETDISHLLSFLRSLR